MGAPALNRISSTHDENADSSPRILEILASTLERCIVKNEKSLKGSNKREVGSVFDGSRVPGLSIRQYIERIFKYANCSNSCFVVAYVYLDRYLQRTKGYLTALNVHRLLITSFVLAVKYVEDECYNNAYYAKVGGISTSEMNKLEMKVLLTLEFRLHVNLKTFDDYCFQLEEAAAAAREKTQSDKARRFCGLSKKGFANKSNFIPVQGHNCK